MLVSNISANSELYNTLSALGALCTEEHRILEGRKITSEDRIETRPLTYDDINRIGYYYPHFDVDIEEKGIFEVWLGDEYIHPNTIEWVEDEYTLYGIVPRKIDVEGVRVTLIYNRNILKRYSNLYEREGYYNHVETIDTTEYPYASMTDPARCAYCMLDGKLSIPEVVRIDDTHIEFRCSYMKSIDFFICGDLAGIYKVKANQGVWIDSIGSHQSYHRYIIDNDPAYPISARFYPCITVDKDCILRVYNDTYDYIPHPELTRLLSYPEFVKVDDPYNTTNKYLKKLKQVDEVILGSDDEETILRKFTVLAKYCYRIWEQFPFFCNEQSDFLICDNTKFGHPTFRKTMVYLMDRAVPNVITSTVPFEPHRDVLFYKGMMFSDYEVYTLTINRDDQIIESDDAMPAYFIVGDYSPDDFTLIKFNTAEDTVINNIGDWIDTKNLVRLHYSLNKFYRNLLVIRGSVIPETEHETAVRVSTVEPTEHDEHLWFELLVNVIPEKFALNPIEQIHSFGLDPNNIPEDIKVGAYSLDLEPDDGPASYSQMLFTYFKLGKAARNKLVFQYGEGVDNPTIQKFDNIWLGALPDPSKTDIPINQTGIDIYGHRPLEVIKDFTSGPGVPSDNIPSVPGDIHSEHPGDGTWGTDDAGINELLNGVGYVEADEYSLDNIKYVNAETGKVIDGDTIDRISTEDKIALILRYITEGNEQEKETVRAIWSQYLTSMDERTLSIAVYKILLTDYVYNTSAALREADAQSENPKPHKYITSINPPIDPDIGMYWLNVSMDANAPVVDAQIKHNLMYIMSAAEPDDEEIGQMWIDIPAATLQHYIADVISHLITEGYYNLPEGFFSNGRASVHFDFGAHGTEGLEPELFVAVPDQKLHEINYEKPENPEPGAIWYEFLNDIDNKVCYSDEESMILRINERLILVQFDNDNVTAFAFDDIVLNFRGKLGLRYISILADLVNSGVIKQSDINIFYKRLITGPDVFEPGLRRLYTGRSHVISTAKVDTKDYAIHYSTNIGRIHIDYRDKSVHNREREAAWRMVIDYSHHDVAFLTDRMMLFVNGRYVNRLDYEEITMGKIQLKNFPETIECIDIFYSTKDTYISRVKKIAMKYWNAKDTSKSIQRPERDYGKMQPIHSCDHTYKGYYDVLLNEFILNGRLMRTLRYLEDHKDEAEEWSRDFVRKFHAISDIDLFGIPAEDARIIIPALSTDETPAYVIKP